jgi:cephalosporin hydroxylase
LQVTSSTGIPHRAARRLGRLTRALLGRAAAPVTNAQADAMTRRFHRLYYDRRPQTWSNTSWLGTKVAKCPLDLWVYQELVQELRPALVIETGTFLGGSALFFASCMDLVDHGRVITIDVEPRPGRPTHPRITYLSGSSTDPSILETVRREAAEGGTVMVVLDSDHTYDHVLAELDAYAPLVTENSYLVVEDTNVNGNPVLPDFGPGPHEAVDAFLERRPPFVRDRTREKFLLTFNPGGWLRRLPETETGSR